MPSLTHPPSANPKPATPHDPAHANSSNADHTTASGEKPTSAFTAITDTEFIPSLEEAPKTRIALSHMLLLSLVAGGVLAAWYMDLEIFQIFGQGREAAIGLGLVTVALMVLLAWSGSLMVDWFALVKEYWWLSMPVGGAATLALVMMQEQATGLKEVE